MSVLNLRGSVDFDKMLFKSLEDAYFYDISSGELLAQLDEPTNCEFSGEEEEQEYNGKSGSLIAILKKNKKFNVKIDNAYVTAGGLATQMGADIVKASSDNKIVIEREELVTAVTANNVTTLTLTDTPISSTGVKRVYPAYDDNSANVDGKLTVTTDYTVSDKTITLVDNTKTGNFIVIYDTEVSTGRLIVNDANSFSKDVRGIFNVMLIDPCDNNKEYLTQVTVPKLSISGNFTISMGDNPATMSVEGKAIKSFCGGSSELCTWAIV